MNPNHFEFSKLILFFVGIATMAVTAFTLYIVYVTADTSPLCYLIPAIFAECSAATVAYYAKTKAENTLKIAEYIRQGQFKIKDIKTANAIMNGLEVSAEQQEQQPEPQPERESMK